MNSKHIVLCMACLIAFGVAPAHAQPDGKASKTIELKPLKPLADASAAPGESPAVLNILEVQDMKINEVLDLIAVKADVKINAPRDLSGRVTIFLQNVDVRDALRIILDTNNLAYYESDGVFNVVSAAEFERLFGFAFGQKIQTRMFELEYADGNDLLPILEQMKGVAGRVVYNPDANSFLVSEEPPKLAAIEDFLKAVDVKTQEATVELKNVRPDEILEQVQSALTGGIGKVATDSVRRTITVTDTALKVGEIREMITALDVKGHEVYIKTQVIQIILNDEHLTGVDWEAIVSGYKPVAFEGFKGPDGSEQERQLHLGTVSAEDFTVLLDALDTVGIINTTDNGRLVVSGEDEFPMDITYMEDTSANDAEKQFEQNENVTYYLKPKVMLDGEINLRIRPEFKFSDKYEFGRTITAAEAVGAAPGETVVIGGLFKDIKVESLWKIPLLGDLPLLGFAFRNQYQQIRKTEVITFLTPRIEEIQP